MPIFLPFTSAKDFIGEFAGTTRYWSDALMKTTALRLLKGFLLYSSCPL